MKQVTMRGRLYLVPTPLDFGCEPQGQDMAPLTDVLPLGTLSVAAGITHWITENAKSTRAFLKRVAITHALAQPLQSHSITELPRRVHKQGDHSPTNDNEAQTRQWLAPALDGADIGLVSEAGMPAIADPGSSVVRAAHAAGLCVVPLVGPVSLTLALAASGLNGQSFAFVGYVPSDSAGRQQRLKTLEQTAERTGQTQVLIETPYRNEALLQALVQTLQPRTRLAVAFGMSLPRQQTVSRTVAQWRQQSWRQELPLDLPAVFLIGA